MAIARVRISQPDQWCQPLRDWFAGDPSLHPERNVGKTILIDTAKMKQYFEALHGATTKFWFVLPDSQQEHAETAGTHTFGGGGYICEHMLEMD